MFTKLLTELRTKAPGLVGEFRAEWGARIDGSRASLRRSLQDTLPGLDPADVKALDDLSQPPRPSRWSISIAHTHDMGGWLAVPRPAQVGWDIELKARIKLSLVERVSSADEVARAPHPEYLWCAKESFYKALEDEQPAVVSQLTVGSWKAVGNLWRWEGLGPRNGWGFLLAHEPWLVGAMVIP